MTVLYLYATIRSPWNEFFPNTPINIRLCKAYRDRVPVSFLEECTSEADDDVDSDCSRREPIRMEDIAKLREIGSEVKSRVYQQAERRLKLSLVILDVEDTLAKDESSDSDSLQCCVLPSSNRSTITPHIQSEGGEIDYFRSSSYHEGSSRRNRDSRLLRNTDVTLRHPDERSFLGDLKSTSVDIFPLPTLSSKTESSITSTLTPDEKESRRASVARFIAASHHLDDKHLSRTWETSKILSQSSQLRRAESRLRDSTFRSIQKAKNTVLRLLHAQIAARGWGNLGGDDSDDSSHKLRQLSSLSHTRSTQSRDRDDLAQWRLSGAEMLAFVESKPQAYWKRIIYGDNSRLQVTSGDDAMDEEHRSTSSSRWSILTTPLGGSYSGTRSSRFNDDVRVSLAVLQERLQPTAFADMLLQLQEESPSSQTLGLFRKVFMQCNSSFKLPGSIKSNESVNPHWKHKPTAAFTRLVDPLQPLAHCANDRLARIGLPAITGSVRGYLEKIALTQNIYFTTMKKG
ncbi:unnamed protein product [Mesocestoides corti]|uniref:Uncharacterized protein n=2 Tax=Mesocestoides corti TaxID=53468 RepID=A0A0R3UJJ8_MESCO|nr:unnamed protein product [Mesocestoides corti]